MDFMHFCRAFDAQQARDNEAAKKRKKRKSAFLRGLTSTSMRGANGFRGRASPPKAEVKVTEELEQQQHHQQQQQCEGRMLQQKNNVDEEQRDDELAMA